MIQRINKQKWRKKEKQIDRDSFGFSTRGFKYRPHYSERARRICCCCHDRYRIVGY